MNDKASIDIINLDLSKPTSGEKNKDTHNKRKKRLCQVVLKDHPYNVYEYDLGDLMQLESMDLNRIKGGGFTASDILKMLKLAIPECPLEHLKVLTQTESTELLAQINGAIQAVDAGVSSPVFH